MLNFESDFINHKLSYLTNIFTKPGKLRFELLFFFQENHRTNLMARFALVYSNLEQQILGSESINQEIEATTHSFRETHEP